MRCPSESAPKIPNCADVTSNGPPLRDLAAANFGDALAVLLSGGEAQPSNPVITAAKRTSERLGMTTTSLIVQCRLPARHSIGRATDTGRRKKRARDVPARCKEAYLLCISPALNDLTRKAARRG